MVTFTHRDAGTAESGWLASPRLAAVAPLPARTWAGLSRVVVVSAHPDDETLAAAGLIQHAVAAGLEVHLIVATLGEASHPESRTHTPAQLARIRREELRHAVGRLAPDAVIDFLGLDDGDLAAGADAVRTAVAADVAPGPAHTLIVAPWRSDAHTDHDAAGHAAAEAARETGNKLLEYPVWLWHWAPVDSPEVPWAAMRRLRLSAAQQRAKESAISCHFSQVAALSEEPGDEALLDDAVLEHFRRPFEIYLDTAGGLAPDGDHGRAWAASEFDAIHREGAEPWDAPESWYEERKRALTLAALPRRRFGSALEIGCSTGVLTEQLAARADSVLGVDLSRQAVRTATERTRALTSVDIRTLAIPEEWPAGRFDLVVLSEVGYYLHAAALERTLERVLASMTEDGVLVACHWRHPISGWPLDGEDVHRAFGEHPRLHRVGRYEEEDFLLEVFERTDAVRPGDGPAGAP
ncbi:MAG: PIG-L family deacetylase [Actinomycetales bacterium]